MTPAEYSKWLTKQFAPSKQNRKRPSRDD